MKTNIEIEFKTFIDEAKYLELIKHFDLENNIFRQVNYYFDTDDLHFVNNEMVLRIRQKGEDFFKVTLKSHSEQGAYENHILLNKPQALDMLKNGFNASLFGIDKNVRVVAELENHRVSTPYRDGLLFLDRCDYYGHTDFEIEFEVDNFEQGEIEFKQMLDELDVPFRPSIRKSVRAYEKRPIK